MTQEEWILAVYSSSGALLARCVGGVEVGLVGWRLGWWGGGWVGGAEIGMVR